jgi:hypothetical protein
MCLAAGKQEDAFSAGLKLYGYPSVGKQGDTEDFSNIDGIEKIQMN